MGSKVSVLIPARNEPWLKKTVEDVLAKARGDIECLVVLDGYIPDEPLPDDKRLMIIRRGTPLGMRAALNGMASIAHGEFILKADAHTMWGEGFDESLKAACED